MKSAREMSLSRSLMYLLFNSSKHALAFEVVGDQSHFSAPSQALREQIVKRPG
jgi:hypothetical protein